MNLRTAALLCAAGLAAWLLLFARGTPRAPRDWRGGSREGKKPSSPAAAALGACAPCSASDTCPPCPPASACPAAGAAGAAASAGAASSAGDGSVGFDFAAMTASLRARSSFADMEAAEAAIAAHMPAPGAPLKYRLGARFPLPEIPVVVDLTDGTCLLGHCEPEMLPGAATWSPDTHIRDLINSVLLPCALRFRPDDCLAIDFGANFGLHAMAMLQLGARIIAVEPQTDLCVAARLSAAANGWAARSLFLCGGVAASADSPRDARLHLGDGLHRYHGPRTVPQYKQPASVPLYSVAHLLDGYPEGAFIRLAKIDTDSIDCAVLGQFVGLMKTGRIRIGAFIFESWDGSCRADAASLLWWLHTNGFTVYRTHVTERAWDDDHRDVAMQFAPVADRPAIFREQFSQRFNINIWILDRETATSEGLTQVVNEKSQWQYFATTDPFILPGYVTVTL